MPSESSPIYDAAMRYQEEDTPIIMGKITVLILLRLVQRALDFRC